jgi:hypothetical protein
MERTANASAVDVADTAPAAPVSFAFANLDPATGAVQHISYTVGPYGRAAADAAAAAAPAATAESAAAREARREELAAAAAAQKREMLSELLAHFDTNGSGALNFAQFLEFFKAMDSSAALTEAEFAELCESLDMPVATGVTDLAPFFPESDDVEAVRKLHGRVLGVPAADDPFAQLDSSADAVAAGAGGGRRRDWRENSTAAARSAARGGGPGQVPEPEPELQLALGRPNVIQFEELDRAIAAALLPSRAASQEGGGEGGCGGGRAVLICDPSGRASQFLSYQSCEMIDAKGLFILDKLHKRPREEILSDARRSLLTAMRLGKWLHIELGKSAPNFGDVDEPAYFPARQLFAAGFGGRRDLHAALEPAAAAADTADAGGGGGGPSANIWWSQYLADSSVRLPGSWGGWGAGSSNNGSDSASGGGGGGGHGVVLTSCFQPDDYREFLSASWPADGLLIGWPWDEMVQIIIAPPHAT